MMTYRIKCSLLCLGLCTYSVPAFAYLDPGTGSMLFAACVSIFATIIFSVKGLYYKVSQIIARLFLRDNDAIFDKNIKDIVIYSEGAQYWTTFSPIIIPLITKGRKITYLTSGENDPGLSMQLAGFDSLYIGQGDKAYMRLNTLEANICILTTPGLDVFQLRRSKGVKHYSHLVHAPTTGTYKLYSFDYFDSVLCSGVHQINAIRELEIKRELPQKLLFETGCTYMDSLVSGYKEKLSGVSKDNTERSTGGMTTVLLAPSWGTNGLLTKYGATLIRVLIESNYHIILRPHPQSLMVESELLDTLREELSDAGDLEWDFSSSGFESLERADVLVSDFSGIVFDFAFVFEKPVVTLDFEVNLLGLDANDLESGLWELSVISKIGAHVKEDNIDDLPDIIQSLLEGRASNKLLKLRDESVFNFGCAGEVAAQQICSIDTKALSV